MGELYIFAFNFAFINSFKSNVIYLCKVKLSNLLTNPGNLPTLDFHMKAICKD